MTSRGEPIPDSRRPESVMLKTELPSMEDKRSNLSGDVQLRKLDAKYELIDNDPHFRRVIRYYRPSDYWTWAKFTVGVPLAFSGMMMFWKVPRVMGTPLIGGKYWRTTFAIGFVAGFLVSYQDSCKRFWGWTENEREVKMDIEEMVGKLRAGEPLYGKSEMDAYHQRLAASQSRYAQLKFHIFPFLNFANHSQHGVNIEKYLKAMPADERDLLRQRNNEYREKFIAGIKKDYEKSQAGNE